jgi:hypothetical protein
MLDYFKIIVIISDTNELYYMHNYILIERNYSQSVICNFKSELKFLKNYNVVKIIIVIPLISRIVIK